MSLYRDMGGLVLKLRHEAHCLRNYEIDRLKNIINKNLEDSQSVTTQAVWIERYNERADAVSGVANTIEGDLEKYKANGNDVTAMIIELTERLEEAGEENNYTLYCDEYRLKKLKDTLDNIFER